MFFLDLQMDVKGPRFTNNCFIRYTVKLTRAKLPANTGNFTRRLHVKRPHTQFTCVTCSLSVKTGKFTRVYAANTSHRIHANCLQPHVNLPEYNGYFTSNFTWRTHEKLPVNSMQNCLILQAKKQAIGKQKDLQSQAKLPWTADKIPEIAGKNTRHCS